MKKDKFIWRDNISFKETLELIDYWIENYPNRLRNIPKKLSRKIKRKHLEILQQPYREKGKISALELQNLRESIENKLNEKEKEHSYRDWQKQQLKHSRNIYIVNIILVIITFLLCTGTFIMAFTSWKSLEFQKEIFPKTNPDLSFRLENRIYSQNNLIGLASGLNQTFLPVEPYLAILIMNNGKKSTEAMGLRIIDEKNMFWSWILNSPVEAKGLNNAWAQFKFRFKKCEIIQEKEFEKAIQNECNPKQLEAGLMKWYLEINGQFENNPTCYTFNLCVVGDNFTEEWCEKQLSKNLFDEISCFELPN